MSDRQPVDLSRFDNSGYHPGRGVLVRSLWLLVNAAFLQSALPWPSRFKALLLRLFGASVGVGVVIKPRVNVKYPWHIVIGAHAWIGEGVWLDSLAAIDIGAHACLSQDCLVETGNHDWSRPGFDLRMQPVRIEDGAWAAARSTLLPGARLASHAVLCAGAVLAGDTEPWGIYAGVPARRTGERRIATEAAR
jgi:putative colanic acid biosynthesis acetyltransferase WcaF